MPNERDLYEMFNSTDAPNNLDASKIVSKSRRRRLPQQLAVGAFSVLAISGVGALALQTTQLTPPTTVAGVESTANDTAGDGGAESAQIADTSKRAPADKLNLCGATAAEPVPGGYGLTLDITFPTDTPAGTDSVQGTVRMTNTGTQTVTGSTGARPAITLSQDGLVLWHSNGPTVLPLVTVDLDPGESLEYAASFTPVACGVEDDLAEAFREGLPALPAGDYELSAAIDFSADEPSAEVSPFLDLITSERRPITLN